MSKITVDGNTAAATIAYQFSEVSTIYPITPSSTMAELCDTWACGDVKNIFGKKVKVVEMQSEGGASGAMHGALSAGALTSTFTASQGLLLMIPNMYKIAGELTPCVMHVSARAVASHALSIFGDHSDVMAVRQTGWAMLCSSSVQEAMDLALVSHLSTLKSSVPFVHFFDGFRTSHEINTIEEIDMEKVKKYIPYDKIQQFKDRALSSTTPHQQGTAQNPDIFFQNREASNPYYNAVPSIVQSVMDEVFEITNRRYHIFDYYGNPKADKVIVLMGSGASTVTETVNYLIKNDKEKVGVLVVRLYRPFSAKHFCYFLPKSVKKVAVLDRTKEPGSDGEPLYKDVICALKECGRNNIEVYGGRYGLGSKEFTPSMVNAVFDNLKNKTPKNNFTIGIEDDVTNLSLPIKKYIYPNQDSIKCCKFYGFGGDGTVSANKSSIKIIGNNTEYNGQAYFEYDSKKSGNATISHIRFGKNKINDSYLLDTIDFIAVHSQTYVTKYNILNNIKDNGTLLLNTNLNEEELINFLPNSLKRNMAKKHIKFYTIDAYTIAQEIGLGNKINLVMQSAFFKLTNILPYEKAVEEMKKYALKSYGSKGEKIVEMNYKAIDAGNDIKEICVKKEWLELSDDDIFSKSNTSEYYKDFIHPIEKLEGNSLPVSAFDPRGFVPTGTTKYEKRGVATQVPVWNKENCIQCNMCSFVCPHAAIRPKLIKPTNLKDAPQSLNTADAMAEQNLKYVMQVSPLDCTGCGVCANICPAKNKALTMENFEKVAEEINQCYEYLNSIENEKSKIFTPNTLKGSQYNKPYFEFSGACAGCGETPYLKVISQLFGNKMIIANATGCSSIYGGSSPTCPYAIDENGNGIAWANSLFEDNAEFGYGISIANKLQHNNLIELLNEILTDKESTPKLKEQINKYLNVTDATLQRALGESIIVLLKENKSQFLSQVENLKKYFVTESIWIVGGDGWAYDIGFGGLDHILASGENVNILVLDTEVYSNTGGQASKSTPIGAMAKFASLGKRTNKKDLAMIAKSYGNVYVAKVSMGANMNQFLTAVQEAEQYNGVSIIIAYAPCINHGIKMENSQNEMKRAVESGYWQLFRYNPDLINQNKNPFILDSGTSTMEYEEFLKGENRYKSLIAKDEEISKKLFEENKLHAKEMYDSYKKLSEE